MGTLRMAARLLQRLGGSVRRMTTTAAGEDFKRKMVEEGAHAGGTWVTWRKISIFVAIPAVLVVLGMHGRRKKHAAHGRIDFKPYAHLRVRTKPFPWGDGNRSLFHNSLTNALPDGYEGEVHDE